jgi:glycosyltransferase involved in cell wall biosynthesis
MKFNIIMPTYNRPKYIREAVDSILSQYVDLELIIRDGGESIKHLLPEDDRIKYFNEKDGGITDAMNKGLKIATGDIISWANDDDMLVPGILKRVEEEIKDYEWLYGKISLTSGGELGEPWNFERMMKVNIVPQPSVYWTRKAFESAGLMDEENDLASDYAYWIELGKRYTPKFLNEIMATYRVHEDQITSKTPTEQLSQADRVRNKLK